VTALPTLHLLGIPHTVTRPDFSHCAFTQKVYRFGAMMAPLGYRVIHYGAAGATLRGAERVDILTEAEHLELLGHPYHEHGAGFVGDDAVEGSPLYTAFNYAAREAIRERVEPGDVILFPFGHAHAPLSRLPWPVPVHLLESGIGYYDCLLPNRVYESEAVRHGVMGREGRYGVDLDSSRREWVVPNYYDGDDWPEGPGGDYVAFLGRLTKGKGLDVVLRLAAARPDVRFVIVGQGDPDPWRGLPNVELRPPIVGAERAAFLGHARAIIAPSRYVEPFCGSVVEAALCGTPAIPSSFGAFTETVEQGVTGICCQTPAEWVRALDLVRSLDRAAVRNRARARYLLEVVGRQYGRVLFDLQHGGAWE
jgi:glycosyltransferase involved in cell wall biosynthesis